IIGQAIRSDTNTFTVVGVLPPTLPFPVGTLAGSTTTLNQPAEIWTPAVWSPDQKAGKDGDGAGHLLARLKAGTTLQHAEAEIRRIVDQWDPDEKLRGWTMQ